VTHSLETTARCTRSWPETMHRKTIETGCARLSKARVQSTTPLFQIKQLAKQKSITLQSRELTDGVEV
jgi:hypothetical protein